MGQTVRSRKAPVVVIAGLSRDQVLSADTERVAALMDALVRTIEVRRMQPVDEAALHASQSVLGGLARLCLDKVGDLTLQVEDNDLLYRGRCVYHTERPEGSLSSMLFQDGVRELVLAKRLDQGELLALVDVLARAFDEWDRGILDVVTLLWERGFRSIETTCVPLEEWEPGPDHGETPDPGSSCGVPWPCGEDAGTRPEHDAGPTDGEPAGISPWDDWEVLASHDPSGGCATSQDLELSAVEIENIHMVFTIESARPLSEQVASILEEVLASEEEPDDFLETASVMGRLIENAAAAGDFEAANRLADQLDRIAAGKPTMTELFVTMADRVVPSLGTPEFVARLGPILLGQKEVDLEALTTFLARLGPSAAPALCDYLSRAGDMKIRKAICNALAVSCRDDVEILIERLSDSRWFLVRNILYILGKIGHQGVERPLGEALYHTDVRVRREAVRALGGIDSPTSRAYLNSGLRDPDKGVRVLIVHLLAKRKDERVARVIWNAVASPEFATRDEEERTAFFVALGQAGTDALVPTLEESLTHRGATPPRGRDTRPEAALSLAWLGTPRALRVLSREVTSHRPEVRQAVLGALETVKTASAKTVAVR